MDKTEKVVRSKARQLERFKRQAPRRSEPGERLPPGQHVARGFPVLDLGIRPEMDRRTFRLRVEGEVERPLSLSWEELRALPRAEQVSDFHCVTTWSRFDVGWAGVRLRTLLELARPTERARYVIQHCADGYTTNLPLDEVLGENILLAYELEGEPLPPEHGGPLRLVVPHLYGWKSAKFLTGLVFQQHDTPGFWEERGYHDRADPWREERYR